MVQVSSILIGVLIIFIIFFVVVAIYYGVSTKPNVPVNPNVFTEKYGDIAFWRGTDSVPGVRGNCSLYNFPGSNSSVFYPCSVPFPTGLPGQPSLETSTLDALTPENETGCVDIDQIVARKVTRMCDSTVGAKSASECVSPDGTRYKVGEKEIIYTTDGCDVTACDGSLSLVAVGYSVVSNVPACDGIKCLESQTNGGVETATCNISDENQLYRISRYDFNGKPNPSGLLVQILDRSSGMCMVPNGNLDDIVISECGDPGWAAFPELKGDTTTATQQLVWIGELNQFELEDIFSVNSVDQIISKIVGYGVKSMQLRSDDTLGFLPFFWYTNTTPPTADQLRRATGQIIDYTLYNTILLSRTQYKL